MKSSGGQWLLLWALALAPAQGAICFSNNVYHVFPGNNIQDALQLAATNPAAKVVRVHAGEYRPNSRRQALIWFNKKHDGIRLEAEGQVILTAANPELSAPSDPGYPAVVNHVAYFGDGISSNTVLSGFRITGANDSVVRTHTEELEPNRTIPKNWFFYADGGAIKVFGRSSPRILRVEVVDNFSSPCGAGISVQHQGFSQQPVWIEDSVFLRNRAQVTGAAIDLLAGSSAVIKNCLFVGNVSNVGEDVVAKQSGERPFVNSGVVTIFQNSRAVVQNCTFTGNRNGIDDMGGASRYLGCVFFENTLDAGLKGSTRYELAVNAGGTVIGCFIKGKIHDARYVVSSEENVLDAPPPEFDQSFIPMSGDYQKVGYRPVPSQTVSTPRDR